MSESTGYESLRRRYRRQTGQEIYRAVLGDANGVIYEPGRPGYMRVRTREALGLSPYATVRVGGVFNVEPGIGVLLAHDADGELSITGPDFSAQVAAGYDPGLNNPADPNAWGYIDTAMIAILRCEAMSTPATDSTSVAVHSFFYIKAGQAHLFAGDDIDLAAYIPAAETDHVLAGVFLENDDTLGSYASIEQAITTALDLTDVQECLDQAPRDAVPVWFWALYGGLTRLTNDESFLDGRQLFTQSVGFQVDSILTDSSGDILVDNGNVIVG